MDSEYSMSKKSLYQIVKQAIDELDVYGLLEQGAPKDEFEEEALLIAERISPNDSIQQIASVIAEVFNKEFDEHFETSAFLATAERISQLLAADLAEVKCLGIRENHGWIAIGYDIQHRYGYETMISLLDTIIGKYSIKIDRIAKAQVTGMNHIVVWRNWLFNKAQPLSRLKALKEECGEIAVGGVSKRLSDIQLYITLVNQTSIITIQIPQEKYSEEIKRKLDVAAQFIQDLLASYYYHL